MSDFHQAVLLSRVEDRILELLYYEEKPVTFLSMTRRNETNYICWFWLA